MRPMQKQYMPNVNPTTMMKWHENTEYIWNTDKSHWG